MSRRTEVQLAGEIVVRLVSSALLPSTPQAIARTAERLGIRVSDIAEAYEHLRHHTWDPPVEQPCRAARLVPVPAEKLAAKPQRRRPTRQPGPPVTCPEPECAGKVFVDKRGLAAHRRSHEVVVCECGREVIRLGIGPHRKVCPAAQAARGATADG